MNLSVHFLPIFVFVTMYVGSGLYCLAQGIEQAFYQISPVIAIIPALILAFCLQKGSINRRIDLFLEGVRHKDIITMCIIFMLAGAFSVVTTSIGSVDATVNLALLLVPSRFLLIGVFIAAACISTAIGTSMGTIATITPLAVSLANQGAFPLIPGIATVIGGAMFGDNLSMISDTTIAAVSSQGADFSKKLRLNGIIALFAGLITVGILFFLYDQITHIDRIPFSLVLILPYFFLIFIAFCGVNVFVVLIMALIVAGAVGITYSNYSLFEFSKDIMQGFTNMHEIMLLSLFVGGLSGLMQQGIKELSQAISTFGHNIIGFRSAQLIIAGLVSVFDILLANNTVAIIVSGEIARDIAHTYKIPPHYSAVWLDIFSCVFQGIIPYGAQVLLASSIAKVSPLTVIGYVYYCYVLFFVAVVYIISNKAERKI